MTADRPRKSGAKIGSPRSKPSGLNCPACAKVFLIGADFVTQVTATGRTWPSGRAELRCEICGHIWWSKEAAALRHARAVGKAAV